MWTIHFVFLLFFPKLPGKAVSVLTWEDGAGFVWEPPVLQLPAPTPDVELGTPTPGYRGVIARDLEPFADA